MPNAVADNSPDVIPEWMKARKGFCWNDYAKWGEDVRVEMFDGLVYMMGSPENIVTALPIL